MWHLVLGMRKVVKYKQTFESGEVRCRVCYFKCRLSPGDVGRCLVRTNIGGELYNVAYGLLSRMDVVHARDLPMAEGKGLWLKVGSVGCNLRCPGCAFWDLAWNRPVGGEGTRRVEPAQLVEEAVSNGCVGLCFGYTEPLAVLEYVQEAFAIAKKRGMNTALYTNGTFTSEVAQDIVKVCDAFIVDLKAYSREAFRRVSGNAYMSVEVMETVEELFRLGSRVELITRLIPGYNDSVFEIRSIARWIAMKLSPDVVWHLVPFRPVPNLYHVPATGADRLIEASRIAEEEGVKRVILHQ